MHSAHAGAGSPRYTAREERIIEALYILGLTDAFIAAFLGRPRPGLIAKRWRMGLARSRDDPQPLRPQFQITDDARLVLDTLEGVDSWLCKCLDAFQQFVTSYAAGIAKDSR